MIIIEDYIVIITAVTVCALCFIIRKLLGDNNDKWLPLIAGALGVLFNWWNAGSMTPLVFTQGLVSGLGATGLWEAAKIPLELKKEANPDAE